MSKQLPSEQIKLKQTLSLFDAVSIGLGAIIGAGIFVAVGIAAGLAGPGLLVSVLLAGIIASFTAFSFAELGSVIQKDGGVYEYVFQTVSPFFGFITGWLWIAGQVIGGAAVSLGLAAYLNVFIPLNVNLIAALASLFFMFLNFIGTKQSSTVNNILVVIKVLILCIFVLITIFYVQPSNFSQMFPNGFSGIIAGTGIIFFAYLGFGRVATVGEEVKNPEKNIPLSILLALGISAVLYFLVSYTAIGTIGYIGLSHSASPLADAITITGNSFAVWLISIGGIVAAASVLITTILGASRVVFAMARNKQLPEFIAAVHPTFETPYVSIIIMGLLMALAAFIGDLKQTLSLASFSLILSHMLVNYAALKLDKNKQKFKAPFRPIPQLLGIISCGILTISLLQDIWAMAFGVLLAGIVFYYFEKLCKVENLQGTKKKIMLI
jgi:APA family basic amino acid/polyamine antiporter